MKGVPVGGTVNDNRLRGHGCQAEHGSRRGLPSAVIIIQSRLDGPTHGVFSASRVLNPGLDAVVARKYRVRQLTCPRGYPADDLQGLSAHIEKRAGAQGRCRIRIGEV